MEAARWSEVAAYVHDWGAREPGPEPWVDWMRPGLSLLLGPDGVVAPTVGTTRIAAGPLVDGVVRLEWCVPRLVGSPETPTFAELEALVASLHDAFGDELHVLPAAGGVG